MNFYVLGGLSVGLFALAWYFYLCWKNRKDPQIGVALQLLISGVSASGGFKICRCAFSSDFRVAIAKVPYMTGDDAVYFLLGGFALLWFSIEAIWRKLQDFSAES